MMAITVRRLASMIGLALLLVVIAPARAEEGPKVLDDLEGSSGSTASDGPLLVASGHDAA